jgi:hypothetical protein
VHEHSHRRVAWQTDPDGAVARCTPGSSPRGRTERCAGRSSQDRGFPAISTPPNSVKTRFMSFHFLTATHIDILPAKRSTSQNSDTECVFGTDVGSRSSETDTRRNRNCTAVAPSAGQRNCQASVNKLLKPLRRTDQELDTPASQPGSLSNHAP